MGSTSRHVSTGVCFASFALLGVCASASLSLAKDATDCPLIDSQNTVIIPTADVPCSADYAPSVAFDAGIYGGVSDGDEIAGLNASLFVPLADQFALQFDGDVGGFDGDVYGQVGMHALFLQSDFGSFGAYGSWAGFENNDDIYRLGGEVEFNHAQFSLAAVSGWQSKGKRNVFFDSKASFAITDSTSVYTGFAYDNGSVGKLGFEHQLMSSNGSFSGASMFVETRLSKNTDVTALAGINISFGSGNDAYCPKPGARNQFKANHWSMASPRQQTRSEDGGETTRACTFADLGQSLGITIDSNGTGDDGCSYSGLRGNVVDGDVSGCGFTEQSCR
jgi:hypothetical protein